MTKFKGLEDDIQRIVRMVQEHASDLEEMASVYQGKRQGRRRRGRTDWVTDVIPSSRCGENSVIRIRSEELKNISSELSGQARETARIRERLCDVEREISRQSYTEETISRLKALETTLEELQQQITEMSDGLAEVCRITEKTEKNIVDMYEGEKRVCGSL